MYHFQPNDLCRSFKVVCLIVLVLFACVTIKIISRENIALLIRRGVPSQPLKGESSNLETAGHAEAATNERVLLDHKITNDKTLNSSEQLLTKDNPDNGSKGVRWMNNLQHENWPVIVFSVPPKCGSRTLLLVVNSLKKQNNSFQDITTLVDFNIVEKASVNRKVQYVNGAIDKAKAPAFLYTHAFYIPYAPTIAENDGRERTVIRISIVRDPMERKISHYYYSRFRDSEPETKEEQVWRSHLKGIRQESYDDCLRFRRQECVAEIFQVRLITQFCGYDKRCRTKSQFALERAKYNVENHFMLVGLMEEYNDFMRVLSKMLPSEFGGSTKIYNDIMKSYKQSSMKTQKKEKPSNETVTKVKDMMKMDYEFYDFLRERFREQKKFYLGS